MVKTGEAFFTSLGLATRCRRRSGSARCSRSRADREVVCHASAWDVDLRRTTCASRCASSPTRRISITIHHELGHDYYFHAYYKLPALFQQRRQRRLPRGDRRHARALDDARVPEAASASSTSVPDDEQGGHQRADEDGARARSRSCRSACSIDQWRWDVFSGKTTPAEYNKAWWALRMKYQGVAPPGAAHRGGLRSGREVPRPGEHAVHALLPRAHLPVPVPPRAVQGRRPQRARSTSARSTATRRPASEAARRCSRSARASRGPTRSRRSPASAADGRERDARVLRAARKRGSRSRTRARRCGW